MNKNSNGYMKITVVNEKECSVEINGNFNFADLIAMLCTGVEAAAAATKISRDTIADMMCMTTKDMTAKQGDANKSPLDKLIEEIVKEVRK